MTWLAAAETLLSVASAVPLSAPVARSVLAPGPGFARDCRMLAVYAELVEAAPAPGAELDGIGCAVLSVPTLHLAFVADCVPVPGDDGTPPPAVAITEWTREFLADSELLWNAVADAALDGTLGDCRSLRIEPARVVGPGGRVAEFNLPVRLLSL